MRREPLSVVCPLAALTMLGVLSAQDPPRHVEGPVGERIAEFTARIAAFGFGGAVLAAHDGGRKVQRHGGGVRGFVGELRRWPEQDAMLCVLGHRTDGPLGEVVRGVEAILFGGTADTPVPMPIAVGRELVGTWTLGGRRLVIREQGDALHAALHWGEAGPVTRGVLVGAGLTELGFFDWSARTPLRVERGDDDKVRALVLETLVFERQ